MLQTRLQTKLQTRLQTKLQTNNAGNQEQCWQPITQRCNIVFSNMLSTSHLLLKIFKLVSSSRFSILMRHATPIEIIGNVVGLANFVNEVLANAEWVHVSCLLGDDRRERSSFVAAPFSKTRLHGCGRCARTERTLEH